MLQVSVMKTEFNLLLKIVSYVSGSIENASDIRLPCKPVRGFCKIEQTIYSFPTGITPILSIFLKPTNSKYLETNQVITRQLFSLN